MNALITTLFVIPALLNLAPILGVVSAGRLEAGYGISLGDPNLVVLMRHRAVLFGIVGSLMLVAAFHPPLRTMAVGIGFASMLSFVVLAWLDGPVNAELRRLVIADLVGLAFLVAAAWLDRSAH